MKGDSGFEDARAERHNRLVAEWLVLGRGCGAQEVPLDGYSPDISFRCPGLVYVDVKDPGKANLAIAADEFDEQEAKWSPMVYAWKEGSRWHYANHAMLRQRMIGGRRPPTETGSNTDWYMFRRSG